MSDELNPGSPQNPTPPPAQPAPPQMAPINYSQPPSPGQPIQNDPLQSIIPTKNPPSLLSYYIGVASLICIFAPILAPISIYFGVKAMRLIKEQPGMPGKGHAIAGFVLSGIGLASFLLI